MEERNREDQVFRTHLKRSFLRYLVVNTFLFLVNWFTSPGHWWVLWVLFGWGTGLLLSTAFHYMDRK